MAFAAKLPTIRNGSSHRQRNSSQESDKRTDSLESVTNESTAVRREFLKEQERRRHQSVAADEARGDSLRILSGGLSVVRDER